MNSSNSGVISTEFVSVSDVFSDFTDISHSNHNRLVKSKRFGKWYMLKGLNAECADKAVFVEMLRKEFELGITLDHPHIIRTIGKENVPSIGDCIVLEYIDGVTFKEWLKSKPSTSERRRVVMELLDAMSYFHSKGVIHRDLKPENILITGNGANVKVIDFGLSDSDQYAILKQPAGSRKYSAPEQSANGTKVDLRADIYAFGALLPELGLRGIYKHIARKATQTAPTDRYANAGQVISAIHNRHRLNIAQTAGITVMLIGMGLYSLARTIPSEQLARATVDTVVREVFRVDTVRSIKEIPVVVEKIVMKDPGEGDSTYITRKKWEKQMVQKAEEGYKKIYTPLVEKYHIISTMEQLQQYSDQLMETFEKVAALNQELFAQIDVNSEFYVRYAMQLAVIQEKHCKPLTASVEKFTKSKQP